jgi:hypothetical protein
MHFTQKKFTSSKIISVDKESAMENSTIARDKISQEAFSRENQFDLLLEIFLNSSWTEKTVPP